MVTFNSYVKLPEGIPNIGSHGGHAWPWLGFPAGVQEMARGSAASSLESGGEGAGQQPTGATDFQKRIFE